MSEPAFAVLTVDNVWRMFGLRLTAGTHVDATVFGFATLQALIDHTPGVRFDVQQFGSIGRAVPWIHDFLSSGGSREAKPAVCLDRTTVWAEDCETLLTRARRQYSRRSCAALRIEHWLAETHKTFGSSARGSSGSSH